MNFYYLECLNEDGNFERNGNFFDIKDAQEEKAKLDEQPCNKKYGIKQSIFEDSIMEKPKRKPLEDGTLPLTEEELKEFEKYWTGTINKTYKMDKLYIDRRKDEIVLMVVHTNNGISIGESFIRDIKAIAYLFERFDLTED